MADPIEAHYTPDGDDWAVAVTGWGRTLTGRAPGLIAARDKADQLVGQLAPEESGRRTVVHMLNGDAVEFTTAYLTARLARTDEPAPPAEPPATSEPAQAGEEATEDKSPEHPEQPEHPEAAREMPAPATSTEDEQEVAAKPTPAPRTEAQTAHPAAQPTQATTPARESRVQT